MKSRIGMLLVLGCVLLIPFLSQAFMVSAHEDERESKAKFQWEHLALRHTIHLDKELSRKINQLGEEGWELVCVSNIARDGNTESTIYYFKRPK